MSIAITVGGAGILGLFMGFLVAVFLQEKRDHYNYMALKSHDGKGCDSTWGTPWASEPDEFALKLGTYDMEIDNGYLLFHRRLVDAKPYGKAPWKPPLVEIEDLEEEDIEVVRTAEESYERIARRLQEIDKERGQV
jgi:hypothetical protein